MCLVKGFVCFRQIPVTEIEHLALVLSPEGEIKNEYESEIVVMVSLSISNLEAH